MKRIAEEKAVAEVRWVEEQRRAELEERRRVMVVAKVWEEAEGCQIMEELMAARCKAIQAAAEEAETE